MRAEKAHDERRRNESVDEISDRDEDHEIEQNLLYTGVHDMIEDRTVPYSFHETDHAIGNRERNGAGARTADQYRNGYVRLSGARIFFYLTRHRLIAAVARAAAA